MTTETEEAKDLNIMEQLLEQHSDVTLPEVGDVVEGTVISAANNEVHIDVKGVAAGVVRGPELDDESGMYTDLQIGETVSATVLDKENETGLMELSFREAGHQKAWEELARIHAEQEVVGGEVLDANKGGLIIRLGGVTGFLPVSQLSVEHYPRVEGANKQKILGRLQEYVGDIFNLAILDLDEAEDKLIFSEKAARSDEQKKMLLSFEVGHTVEGTVTGVVDFGAFVEFGEGLEGLVHISELAWQRIDNPKDIINVGDKVKAEIISIENGKISLSVRRLQEDPWQAVAKKYTIGDLVTGTVLKINPFGAFVELDKDIHGLAHISELSWDKIGSPDEVLKSGEEREFMIVSIEPDKHRLGLSVKQLTPNPKGAAAAKKKAEKGTTGSIVAEALERAEEKKEADEKKATEADAKAAKADEKAEAQVEATDSTDAPTEKIVEAKSEEKPKEEVAEAKSEEEVEETPEEKVEETKS